MTTPLDPEDFMLTDELLLEIAEALGQAHARLVDNSASALGTLVVKTARLDIGFDFSAQARRSTRGVGLRLRPLSRPGLSATSSSDDAQARASNRATISLEVVNVAPLVDAPEPPPAPRPPPRPPATPPVTDKDALAALNTLFDSASSAWPELEAGLRRAVTQIVERVGQQRIAEARALVAALLAELRAWIARVGQVAPVALGDAMRTLDDWIASPLPVPDEE